MNSPPFSVSKVVRNPVISSLNYTNQDYWSLKARMMEIMQQKFSKDFNDFTESSLGLMLIEMWAFIADQISFKIDQVANDLFIDSVTEKTNIMRMADLIGFKPIPPTPAKAMFSLNINQNLSNDVPIQTPLVVSFNADGGEKFMELYSADENNNPIIGQPIVIPAGSNSTTSVVGVEGRTNQKIVEGTGNSWQHITLAINNVLWKSIKLTVDGVAWEEVDALKNVGPCFKVEYTNKYRAVIIFGNNDVGMIPPKGSVIKITYRVGGGSAGNIITGGINKSIPLHVSGVGHMLTCHVTNYTKAEGGYDGDTIEDIRSKMPLYMESQNRAVTGDDYKAICDNFASSTNGIIGKSVAALRNYGCAGNIVDVYVLARNGPIGLIKANDNLKKELSNSLLKKKMFSDYVCIRDGQVVLVDIRVELILSKANKRNEQAIRDKVYRRIANFLSLANWEFGQSLRDSDIIKSIADVKEIEHVDISFTTVKSIEQNQGSVNLVSVGFNEIVRPDNMYINFQYKA